MLVIHAVDDTSGAHAVNDMMGEGEVFTRYDDRFSPYSILKKLRLTKAKLHFDRIGAAELELGVGVGWIVRLIFILELSC